MFLIFFLSLMAVAQDFDGEISQLDQEIQPLKRDAGVWQRRLNELYDAEDPSIHLYSSRKDVVTLAGLFAFRRKSASRFSPLSTVENRLSKQRYFTQQSASSSVPDKVQELGLGAELRWVSRRRTHPEVTLDYDHTIADRTLLGSDSGKYHGYFDTYASSLGNHFQLSERLKLTTVLAFTHRENHSEEPNDSADKLSETSNEWGFHPSLDRKYDWGILSLFAGASIGDVDTLQSANDTFNTQTLGVRSSFDKRPIKSTYEIGAHRLERTYTGEYVLYTYQPFASAAWSGFFEKKGAIALGYQMLIRKRSDGPASRYNPQQVTIDPSWVINEDGKNFLRMQNLTIHMPLRVVFEDGVNNHLILSTTVEGTIEIANHVHIRPTFTAEYDQHYETDKDNFGFHFGLGL